VVTTTKLGIKETKTVTVTTVTAQVIATAETFSVLTVTSAALSIAQTATQEAGYRITVTALVPITAIPAV
jgi:hypothetical protein